jgi:prepilin-type processing-associated H-X9-DG protein
MTAILPYLPVRTGIDLTIPWDDPANSAYFRGIVPYFINPDVDALRDARGYALAHYAGNVHVVGRRRPLAPDEVTGGAANTIVAGEAAEGFRAWGDPANLRDPARGINRDPDGFGGPSGAGAQMLFLDGSVRFFTRTTGPDVLRRLGQPRPPG